MFGRSKLGVSVHILADFRKSRAIRVPSGSVLALFAKLSSHRGNRHRVEFSCSAVMASGRRISVRSPTLARATSPSRVPNACTPLIADRSSSSASNTPGSEKQAWAST